MSSRNLVIGLVASVVTVALAIGLLLLLDASDREDALELPDTVGDLVAADTDAAYPDGAQPMVIERQRTADGVTRDGYADAFDDAATGARVYLDPDGSATPVAVVAIAADAGPLVPLDGFADPELEGFALPEVERVTDGDVECLLLRNLPPRAGTDYQPDQATPDAVYCQRRSGSLTVRARAATGDVDLLVRVVDDLWDGLD